jgi:hypothetical protein
MAQTRRSGHWEIHPVEKVESIDTGTPFQIGPGARIASWPIVKRYKVTNQNFGIPTKSNYAKLVGKVKSITRNAESGDLYVSLQLQTKTFTAMIPQYYVADFDTNTQTARFLHLPNFAAINYVLAPNLQTKRSFYGLKNWKFQEGLALPAMQPVESIR